VAIAAPIDVVVDVEIEDLDRDPYPFYARMRAESPVAWLPAVGRVLVATWDLCQEAGRNWQVFGPTEDLFNRVYGDPNVMSLTGEAHRVLREAVRAPFTPAAVAACRETVLRPVAVSRVEAIRERGRAEASADICEPISQRAIGDLVGFADVADDVLNRWFHDYGAYMVDLSGSEELAARGRAAKADVRRYLERREAELRARPDGTAIASLLTHGSEAGRPIEEMIGTIGVIIVGGFQEPAHATANALHGLLGRPELARRMAADPAALSGAALEEGLRWLSPFGMTEKRTTADVVLGGVAIPPGTEIALGIASANHDRARFAHAEVFDPDRPRLGHVAFGFGTHFCIGNIVARALGAIVLEELFARLPNLRLDPDDEPFVHGWHVRAAKRLPVVWDA
jgi:cytochrome P450